MVNKDLYLWMLSLGQEYILSTVLLLRMQRETHKQPKCLGSLPCKGISPSSLWVFVSPFYNMTEQDTWRPTPESFLGPAPLPAVDRGGQGQGGESCCPFLAAGILGRPGPGLAPWT